MTEPFVKHLLAVSSEYGDAMREAANMIEEVTADRDRWRKIALWNLEGFGETQAVGQQHGFLVFS